jgi:hypothetical protein
VDRIRNSIESRERRDSRDVEGEPVGYEVVNKRRGSGKGAGEAEGAMVGEEREDLDDGVVGMLDVMDAEVSTGMYLPLCGRMCIAGKQQVRLHVKSCLLVG